MDSLVAKVKFDDVDVLLVKPLTYMNLSGEAVQPILRYYRGEPGDLLVVYDDLDLPPGQLRVRASGSSGGHRGVQSVIDCLGTADFARLRVGIGRPPQGMTAAEYVLQPLSRDELEWYADAVRAAAAAARTWAREGTGVAMNKYNRATS